MVGAATRRRIRDAALLALTVASARGALAQATSAVTLRAARRDTIVLDAATSVTAVFSLRNRTSAAVDVEPKLTLPPGWSTLVAPPAITLDANSSDSWIASVALPGGAAAGVYALRATLGDGAVTDSVLVRIAERRVLEVTPADAPAFSGAGDAYASRFVVRNRGNVASSVTVGATSSAGSRIEPDSRAFDLVPGQTRTVVARVIAPFVGERPIEDVVELTATDATSREVHASASSNVLLVARSARPATLATMPAELTIRGARSGSGVSPLALTGAGPIAPGSNTTMDFALRLPAGPPTVFGERDEYRLDIANERYTVRLGDGSHAFSPLSGSGYLGFGGEIQRDGERWSSGAYLAKDRWNPNGPTEGAVFARRKLSGDETSVSTVLVHRDGGVGAAALGARAALPYGARLDVETSRSDSADVTGVAQRAQLLGRTRWVAYDAGWLRATPTFAGPTRGNEYKHAAVTLRPDGPVSFAAMANDYAATSVVDMMPGDRSRSRGLLFESATSDGSSLSYERVVQTSSAAPSLSFLQQSVRLRTHRQVGRFDLRTGLGRHVVESSAMMKSSFVSFDAAAHTTVGPRGSVDFYAERGAGGVVASLARPGTSVGAATSLRLPRDFSLHANGSTMLSGNLAVSSLSQLDLTVSKRLRNGMTAALRQHVAILPDGVRPVGMNGLYLELRAPLAMPTVPLHAPGRVDGRVVDAATGRGLPDVLVRVGKHAAISDANGRVRLAGVEAGHYNVSMESADRARGGVTVGDASITVSAHTDAPTTFAAALATGARVRASVRQSASTAARTLGAADSLVDAGPLGNVVIALMGTHDTIYLATSAEGTIDFGVVAPGRWTAQVMAEDVPAFHAFDHEKYSLVIRAGEQRDLEFRLLPKRRPVTVLASDEARVLTANSPVTTDAVVPRERDTVVVAEKSAAPSRLRASPPKVPARPVRTSRVRPEFQRGDSQRATHAPARPVVAASVELQAAPRAAVAHTSSVEKSSPRRSWRWLATACALAWLLLLALLRRKKSAQ